MKEKFKVKGIRKSLFKACHALKFTAMFLVLSLVVQVATVSGLFAQEPVKHKITGKVTSASDNSPIPGASVQVKGKAIGSVTNIDGDFTVEVADDDIIIVSFVGYITEEVAVAGKSSLDVKLVEDVTKLDEIVVVGYNSTQKKNLASSVAVVNDKALANLTTTDVLQALQGKMSGVQVTNKNGDPGSGAKVIIRGAGSFTSSAPLIVIDGIVDVNADISAISVQDVQSVTVLKDASTAAIYGAAAANGVMIITTKNGEKGAMKVSYSGSYGISTIAKKMSMLNASQYVDLVTDIQANNKSDITDYLKSPDARITRTNWQDAIFRTAPVTEHSIRLAGGSESVRYSFSTGFFDQKSIIIDSRFQRVHFNTKLSENLLKNRVKLGQSLRMRYDVTKGSTASFYDALLMPPYLTIYDPSVLGGYARADKIRDLNDANNPFASVYLSPKTDRGVHTELDLDGEVSIINGLSFKSQARLILDNSHSQTFNYPVQAGNNTRSTATMNESYTYSYNLILDNFFSFDRTFGVHNINLTAGNTYRPSGYYGNVSLAGSDYSSAAIQNVALADTKSITGASVNGAKSVLSYFGRLGYTFNEKYVINASVRRDGSSVFGINNQWGNFYGVGAAWNISKESFMRSVSSIDDLKLRVSYGKTGNDNIGMFLTTPTVWKGSTNNLVYSMGDIDGTYAHGATVSAAPNPDLKWEETTQTDIGFDLGLFKNTKIVFDYFYRDNKDLLINTELPTSTGLGTPGNTPTKWVNGASMKNKGLELSITYNGKVDKLTWDVSLNATYNTNEVYALGTLNNTPITYGNSRTDIGQPLASYYGYKVDHVAIDQADVDKLNARAKKGKSEYQAGLKPGDRIYQDINGDSIVDDKDRTFIGNPSPKWQYGMTLNCQYKGFDFQLMLQGLAGVDIANMNHGTFEGMARPFNSFSTVLNRWRKPGDVTTLPAAGQDVSQNTLFADWFVEKGDYLRVKNIALGYTLPSSVFKFGKLRVYIALQNILTFTKYTGYDPEVSSSDDADGRAYIFTRGVDNMQHPNPKIYRVGLQLNF
jgi:TonB-linked SusC/RagA family outer membrane protein